jgi:hypothetical protein
MSDITLCSEFDVANLTFEDKLEEGVVKSSKIKYGKSALKLQTPELRSLFEFSQMKDKKTQKVLNEKKTNFNLSLDGHCEPNKRASVEAFYNVLNRLSEKAIQVATKNSLEWFGDDYNEDTLKVFFKKNIKFSMKKDENGRKTKEVNTDYAPTIGFSLWKNDVLDEEGSKLGDRVSVNAVDGLNDPLDINTIDIKNALVTCIVTPSLWVGNNMFGITFKVLKMRVIPQSNNQSKVFNYRNDIDTVGVSDDESNEGEEPKYSIPKVSATNYNDSEDDL